MYAAGNFFEAKQKNNIYLLTLFLHVKYLQSSRCIFHKYQSLFSQ